MKYTITAGHGGTDPGATRTYAGVVYREADLMAELRDLVASRLRDRGHEVRTDGEGTLNRPLAYAATLIPGSGVALDLHVNAFTRPAGLPPASGVEVVSAERHKDLARKLARGIASVLGVRVRGDGGWLREQDTPHKRLLYVGAGGLIVETFFLSNEPELRAYLARKYLVADAIAQAVVA